MNSLTEQDNMPDLIASTEGLRRLRSATAALHRCLDHDSRMPLLLSSEMTLSQYAEILKSMYAIYRRVESLIEQAELEYGSVVQWESKLPWIGADLANLGHSPPPVADNDGSAPLTGLDQVAGTLYVIEGASLGGQVICAKILKNWGPQAQSCTRFFNGHGKTTRARWALASQRINSILIDEHTIGRACESARAGFDLFIAELAVPSVESATTAGIPAWEKLI